MPHVVMLPDAIERKLKVDERQEVVTFINDLIANTSDELKKDVIEITAEKFERRLAVEIVNLKEELTDKIANLETRLTERIANSETKMAEKIVDSEKRLGERIVDTETRIMNLETRLTEKILDSEKRLTERIVNTETKIMKLETGLTERIMSSEIKTANHKAELLKWMFIFWLGNVFTVIGGLVGILKLAKVF
jgi:hypothetical protein